MIVYFDTSAVIPLIVAEPGSATCERLWSEATRVLSVRLVYVEARAALAMAHRIDRLAPKDLASAVEMLDQLVSQIDNVEVTEALVRAAGEIATRQELRGYDAVHLAAAVAVADDDTVFLSGDRQQLAAAGRLGLTTALAA